MLKLALKELEQLQHTGLADQSEVIGLHRVLHIYIYGCCNNI